MVRAVFGTFNKIFLPEHVKLLKDAQHDYDKSPRPLLDEGQIDDMEQLLSERLTNKTILEFTTWKDGYFNSRIGFANDLAVFIRNDHYLRGELNGLLYKRKYVINVFPIPSSILQ